MAPSGDSPSMVSREQEQEYVKVTEPLLCTGCPTSISDKPYIII